MLTKYRDILQNPDVAPIDKLLYIAIGNKYPPNIATASNSELAACIGTTPRNIQRALQRLKQGRYVYMEYANRNTRTIYQNIRQSEHTPYKAPYRRNRTAGGTYPEDKTTPTAPQNLRIPRDHTRRIKRHFKKLYTDYTGVQARHGNTRADYPPSYFIYRRLIEGGEHPTALYNWMIAYRDERINNGHDAPRLDKVLQQLLYRSLIRPLT